MSLTPTLVPLLTVVLGLSLEACAPPTPKADPPRGSQIAAIGTLMAINAGGQLVGPT